MSQEGESEEEGIFDERQVDIPEKERITQLIRSANLQEQMNHFFEIQLSPDNIAVFKAEIDQAHLHTMLSKDERLTELFKVLEIHPDFKRYFKVAMETDVKEKKVVRDKIYSLTETELIDMIGRVIEILSFFIPRTELLIEILKNATDKYDSYVFSSVPSQVRKGVPSFGMNRSETAARLADEGKAPKDIADEIGVELKQVYSYIKAGRKKKESETKKEAVVA